MSYRKLLDIAAGLVMAAASLGPAPIQASRTPQAIEDGSATVNVLALAPTGPVTDACFTEYTGDGVTDFASPDAQALRNALAAVVPGGTVKVAGTCAGAILEGGTTQVALVTTTLSLIGGYTPTDWVNSYPLTQPTTLDALGAGRVLFFSGSNGNIGNLSVQNGNVFDGSGGGIFASGALTLTHVNVLRNTAQYDGGGLYASGSLMVDDSNVVSNTAQGSGGGAVAVGSATLNGGLFGGNRALSYDGGGLSAPSTSALIALVVSGTQFISNTAMWSGGGLQSWSILTITGGLFQDNRALSGAGGGLWAEQTSSLSRTQFISNNAQYGGGGATIDYGPVLIVETLFQGNRSLASNGGGLSSRNLTLRNSRMIGNVAYASGGGLRVFGSATLTGVTFEGNQALTCNGGGLFQNVRYPSEESFCTSFSSYSTNLGITDTQFISNTAGISGGGLWADTRLNLNETTFIGNHAQKQGGGANSSGPTTLTGGLFQDNGAAVDGGGLFAGSTLGLIGTRFVRNTAESGGGLYHWNGSGRLVNALFAGNVSDSTLGTAMYLDSPGPVQLLHITIGSPGLMDGSPVFVAAGTVWITNSIISSHTVGVMRAAGSVTEDYTLFDGVTTPRAGVVNSGGHSFTGTAAFANPAYADYHLLPGSPAIDSGVNGGITADFEGTPRPLGAGFDIGYDEWGGPPRAYLPVVEVAAIAPSPARAILALSVEDSDISIRASAPSSLDLLTPEPAAPTADACFAEYTGDNTSDFSSADGQALRNALSAVSPGGTVKVAGTCAGAIAEGITTQVARVTKAIALVGGYTPTNWVNSYPLTQPTTLDAQGGGRVLTFDQVDGNVANLTVQNGYQVGTNAYAGGIYGMGTLVMTNVNVLSNTAQWQGGGVLAGDVTLTGGLFQNNRTWTGEGGGLLAYGTLTISGTEFVANNSGANGGGVHAEGAVTINGGLFRLNQSANGGGGGLSVLGAFVYSSLAMTGTRFIENSARYGGGGVLTHGETRMTDVLLRGNWAIRQDGGALWTEGALSAIDTQFIDNSAGYFGGGARASGSMNVTGGLFQGNWAVRQDGGGIWAQSALALTSTRFVSNIARMGGGGLTVSGTLALNHVGFDSNVSRRYGGGAYASSIVTVFDGVFQDNRATLGGAALAAQGSLTLTNTQFLGNVAAVGGALWHAGPTGRLVNALFARNAATSTLGSAMYLSSTGNVAVLHTTIASPTLGGGAAIYVVAGAVRLTDTLIASYTVGISNAGGTVSENYTMFSGVATPRAGAVGVGANSFTGTAAFVNPALNDYHLALGSAAINAGVNAGVFLDFEGTSRPFGGGFDIGYDEWGVSLRAYLPAALR